MTLWNPSLTSLTSQEIKGRDFPVSFTMEETSPAVRVEPVTLAMTKRHLNRPTPPADDLLEGWIIEAREYIEEQTERQLVDAVWEYALDGFPASGQIELPRPPLVNVVSVVYDDGDGEEQTLATSSYRVLPSALYEGSPLAGSIDPFCERGWIELTAGSSWPSTIARARSVRIRRTCGYGDTVAEIPQIIKSAIYTLVGHRYRNRNEVIDKPLHQIPMGASQTILTLKRRALPRLIPRTL